MPESCLKLLDYIYNKALDYEAEIKLIKKNEIKEKDTQVKLEEYLKKAILLAETKDILINPSDHELFNQFSIISEILDISNLKISEVFDVLYYHINRNITNNRGSKAINLTCVLEHKFKNVSEQDLLDMELSGRLEKILTGQFDKVNAKEAEVIGEVYSNIDKYVQDLKPLLDSCTNIFNYYQELFDGCDVVDAIIEEFAKLGVIESVLNKIRVYLTKIVQKHASVIKTSNVYTSSKASYRVKNQEDTYLSSKEVRAMKGQISRFYDTIREKLRDIPNYAELIETISNLEALREVPLNKIGEFIEMVIAYYQKNDKILTSDEEEMTNLASLMFKYKCSKDQIRGFMEPFFTRILDDQNIITKYLTNCERYHKIDHDKACELDQYFASLFIADDELYTTTKELIELGIEDTFADSEVEEYELNKIKERGIKK